MYARSLRLPDYSFFLFGPRSTGKTTWLRSMLPDAHWKNLLVDEDYLPLLGDSSLLRREVEALAPGSWVVLDEVQRLPNLLNEVHELISRRGDDIKFAMSGSSARKLRRSDVNLLAGRAIERMMLPLTSRELADDYDLDQALARGTLPNVVTRNDLAVEILSSYVGTYLKQEIQQEALVKDLGSFHRFLRIAGIVNAEPVSVSAIARDAGVARSTVERYFDVLVDTLIGFRLPAWQPRVKVRERKRPKFYLFDTGVVRALTGRLRDPVVDLETGKLLETLILHELRSAIATLGCGGELSYWRSSGGAEIDFVWSRGPHAVGFEVKAAKTWRREASKALKEMKSAGALTRCYGLYRGDSVLKDGEVLVLPVVDFLERLHDGEILDCDKELKRRC